MKKRKLIVLLLLTLMAFTLISCDSNKESKEFKNQTNAESTVKEDNTAKSEKILSINNVAKKSSSEVAQVLGQSEKIEEHEKYILNYYMNGQVEIAFYNDVAAKITINPNSDIPFYSNSKQQSQTLKVIGLDNNIPSASFSNKLTTRWNKINNLYEVSIFKKAKDNTVNYIYVITDEKYK